MLGPYREKLLAPDEIVALITRPHILTFLRDVIGAFALFLLTLGTAVALEQQALLPGALPEYRSYIVTFLLVVSLIGVVLALAAWVRWRSHEIVVTNRRVIKIAGILSKDVIDYSLDAITDLRMRQSWLGRLFDYGDVDILTASDATAHSAAHDTFPVIGGPITFAHAVQNQRERRRLRIDG